jgi:predicted transcriptional regulator
LNLEKAANEGLAREDFDSLVSDEVILTTKIEGLLQEGALKRKGSSDSARFIMTDKGSLFLRLFLIYRRLMGRARRAS